MTEILSEPEDCDKFLKKLSSWYRDITKLVLREVEEIQVWNNYFLRSVEPMLLTSVETSRADIERYHKVCVPWGWVFG